MESFKAVRYINPTLYIFKQLFLFVWTSDQNVCVPPSVPGLNAALVACCGWLCAAALATSLHAVETVGWVEHSASTQPGPVDQSGWAVCLSCCWEAVSPSLGQIWFFQLLWSISRLLFRKSHSSLSLDCFIKSCWRSYLPSVWLFSSTWNALFTLSHVRLFYSISQHLKTERSWTGRKEEQKH